MDFEIIFIGEMNKIEEEMFMNIDGIKRYDAFKKSPQYRKYRIKAIKNVAHGATKAAIIALLTYTFYEFLKASTKNYKDKKVE